MKTPIETFRAAVEEEINKISDMSKDERDTYVIREFAQRIIALTADTMVGEKVEPLPQSMGTGYSLKNKVIRGYNQRITEEKLLAEELKEL